jgi:hypothetical protein
MNTAIRLIIALLVCFAGVLGSFGFLRRIRTVEHDHKQTELLTAAKNGHEQKLQRQIDQNATELADWEKRIAAEKEKLPLLEKKWEARPKLFSANNCVRVPIPKIDLFSVAPLSCKRDMSKEMMAFLKLTDKERKAVSTLITTTLNQISQFERQNASTQTDGAKTTITVKAFPEKGASIKKAFWDGLMGILGSTRTEVFRVFNRPGKHGGRVEYAFMFWGHNDYCFVLSRKNGHQYLRIKYQEPDGTWRLGSGGGLHSPSSKHLIARLRPLAPEFFRENAR